MEHSEDFPGPPPAWLLLGTSSMRPRVCLASGGCSDSPLGSCWGFVGHGHFLPAKATESEGGPGREGIPVDMKPGEGQAVPSRPKGDGAKPGPGGAAQPNLSSSETPTGSKSKGAEWACGGQGRDGATDRAHDVQSKWNSVRRHFWRMKCVLLSSLGTGEKVSPQVHSQKKGWDKHPAKQRATAFHAAQISGCP